MAPTPPLSLPPTHAHTHKHTHTGRVNQLLGQTPTVSGDYSPVRLASAFLTDGLYPSDFNNEDRGYWHSDRENPAWVEVPLPQASIIHTVRLVNRADCCHGRINGAIVSGKDSSGVLHQCGGSLSTDGPGMPITVECDSKVPFVAIRVELQTGQHLQIAELEALAADT